MVVERRRCVDRDPLPASQRRVEPAKAAMPACPPQMHADNCRTSAPNGRMWVDNSLMYVYNRPMHAYMRPMYACNRLMYADNALL